MNAAPPPALHRRVHWVTCELDARGEIDAHAAMCLRHAIAGADRVATEMILIDLRDLSAIDSGRLALFRTHQAGCRARGIALGLLISGHDRHAHIADAFVLAGLGDALHYTREPRRTVRLLEAVQSGRRGRLARIARRVGPSRRVHRPRPGWRAGAR